MRDRGLTIGQRPDLKFVKLDRGAPIALSECLVEMEAPKKVQRDLLKEKIIFVTVIVMFVTGLSMYFQTE